MTDLLTPEDIVGRAIELAKPTASTEGDDPVAVLCAAADGRRGVLEAARDLVAARVHRSVDDWDATAALTLLNRSLSELPRFDPLDWRVRWTQRFRRP